jgi:hypothetical protein
MNVYKECVLVYEKRYSRYGIQKMGNLPNELLRQSNGRWKKITNIWCFLLGKKNWKYSKKRCIHIEQKQTTKE